MFDPLVWYSYEYERPQQDLPVIIWRRGYYIDSFREEVVVPKDFPEWFNISGLRWRPTGIFKEFGGKITRYGLQSASLNSVWLNALSGGLRGLEASAQSQEACKESWDQ